jgi:hypothetical protein
MTNPDYLTKAEIQVLVGDIINECIDDKHDWHPEDAYCQIENALKYAFFALSHQIYVRAGKREKFSESA